MKIGIWSDSIGFPSLPLTKLSAFYKLSGNNSMEFIEPAGAYDLVYLSKTFNLPTVKKISIRKF